MSDSHRPYHSAYDQDLEQALLGTLLFDPTMIVIAAEHIQPADLFFAPHPAVLELMIEFDMVAKPVTPVTLQGWLKHDEEFIKAGGHSYLAELTLSAPANTEKGRPAFVVGVAKDLKAHALRRLALQTINDASEDLVNRKPIVETLANVVQIADEIAARQVEDVHGTRDAAAVTHALLRDIDRQLVDERSYACMSEIRDLDQITGGFVPGNAIFIGGRPGMGKTIVGAEICMAAARAGWEPDYFSLEMPARELGARMACSIDYDEALREGRPPLQYSKLIQMSATSEERARAARAAILLRNYPIEIFDMEDLTMARIAAIARARAAKAARKGVRKLTVIDHLGLIEPDSRYRGRKVDELTMTTKQTKQLAKRTMTPIIMLCQLNREVEGRDDKKPRISDFRDSGSIEQDADLLMALYRGDYYAEQRRREAKGKGGEREAKADTQNAEVKDQLEWGVLKNRNGATGEAKCHIDIKSGAIRNEKPVREVRQTALHGIGEALNNIPD